MGRMQEPEPTLMLGGRMVTGTCLGARRIDPGCWNCGGRNSSFQVELPGAVVVLEADWPMMPVLLPLNGLHLGERVIGEFPLVVVVLLLARSEWIVWGCPGKADDSRAAEGLAAAEAGTAARAAARERTPRRRCAAGRACRAWTVSPRSRSRCCWSRCRTTTARSLCPTSRKSNCSS